MARIVVVPISLTVCALSNIPFVFGRFEFYFALLYIFYNENVLVIWGRFQFKKAWDWSLNSVLFDILDICGLVH
jgi:hypothetical protein